MTDIKIDKKATDYLKGTIGGGAGGSAINNTIDFYQAVVGKHLNPTKFKALLVEAGCDLTQAIYNGINVFFGENYYSTNYTATSFTINSDVDTLNFYVCWKEINLTIPQTITGDNTIAELLDAIADQIAEDVTIIELDLHNSKIGCLGNIAYLYDKFELVDLNDLVACFE